MQFRLRSDIINELLRTNWNTTHTKHISVFVQEIPRQSKQPSHNAQSRLLLKKTHPNPKKSIISPFEHPNTKTHPSNPGYHRGPHGAPKKKNGRRPKRPNGGFRLTSVFTIVGTECRVSCAHGVVVRCLLTSHGGVKPCQCASSGRH